MKQNYLAAMLKTPYTSGNKTISKSGCFTLSTYKTLSTTLVTLEICNTDSHGLLKGEYHCR